MAKASSSTALPSPDLSLLSNSDVSFSLFSPAFESNHFICGTCSDFRCFVNALEFNSSVIIWYFKIPEFKALIVAEIVMLFCDFPSVTLCQFSQIENQICADVILCAVWVYDFHYRSRNRWWKLTSKVMIVKWLDIDKKYI